MSVVFKTVENEEAGIRLDRWFKRHYPDIPHALLERLIRKKDVSVNKMKVTANARLEAGDIIRIPPLKNQNQKKSPLKSISKEEALSVQKMVLYKDNDIIVLNKPAGLAVQGGTKTKHHLDGILDALRFDYDEKPHLVHRLDKETSGILIVARTVKSAADLAYLFREKKIHKTYWALVEGLPTPKKGKIEAPIIQKSFSDGHDQRMTDTSGTNAVSLYQVQDHLDDKISWLQMSPLTGRTHQLRIHAAQVLKTPILGDDKYGHRSIYIKDLPKKMFLHARAISIPKQGGDLIFEAPLPEHFQKAFKAFGFSEKNVQPLFLLRSQK